MKSFVNKLSTTLMVSIMMFTASFQAIADDTEIFFSSVSLSGTTTIQPNVLMVLDTSSSMNSLVDEDGVADSDRRTRLAHMKEALHTILDDANNINVGLMRFHRKGGPVLFPVADINADVNTVLGTGTSGDPQTFNRIKSGSDDVEEAAGVVSANSGELLIGTTTGSGGLLDCGAAGTDTFETRIQEGIHDVEEEDDGDMYHNSSDLELVNDGSRGDQTIGLYFKDINIPQGVTIHCAELEFNADGNHSEETNLKVYIEDVGNASTFNLGNDYDISDRINVATDPHVDWDDVPPISDDEVFTTPDLRSLVQSITDRADWNNNHNMVFVIKGTGKRRAESRNGSSSRAPLLRISYTATPPSSGPVTQDIGLRFSDVKIPKDANITAAYIDFTATETSTDAATIQIEAEDADHSAAYSVGAGSDVSGRTYTSTSPLSWTVPTWQADEVYTSPDLKDLVQEVVNRDDWCGGNAMSFMLSPLAGTRKAFSDDGDESKSPALRIEYEEGTGDGCNAIELQSRVKTSYDDAEEKVSDGSINLTSSDMELNEDGSTEQIVGLRFQDINLASSDTVVSASLEFTVDEVDTDTSNVTIYGEYTGNAQAFSSTNKISTRTKTSASVTWSPNDWDAVDVKHSSPDISAIVQEIISHSGWNALNEMVFIIEGSSGERTAESYDGEPSSAPRLLISVQGSGAGSGAGVTTVRQKLHNIVDEIAYKSGTPIVDTLYEAGLYYRGGEVFFGRTRGGAYDLDAAELADPDNNSHLGSRSEYTRVSHEASYTGSAPTRDGACDADNLAHDDCKTERIEGDATYISPIEYECQDNHIVFLSDGSPSKWALNEVSSPYFGATSSCAGTGNGRCGEEILSFLNNNDQIDDATLGDNQNVTTHTIGFNFSSDYLTDLASAGGGGSYEADTAAELAITFSEIFADVLASPTSFVAPAVTINTFNRLSHRDELYFALFEPSDSPRWQGNLKRYRLDSTGSAPVIVDFEGNPAIDGSSGYFASGAQSWWTGFDDGQEIAEGGFAGELGSSRNLYTYTGTESILSNSENHLVDGNSNLTNALLDIVSEQAIDNQFRENMLDWIKGIDVLDEDEDNSNTDLRKYVGDPLHSRPALITYGGTSTSPDTVAYFGTNEGFIHALDVDDGSEIFAFMPAELLPNIKALMANQGTPADHKYGVDGTITPWVFDSNNDNDLEDTGDHVYLYTGMRRGGNNYYALNVTDRDQPTLLWTIIGGSGDFAELGQSWSQPVKSKVDIGGTEKDVLIFAGGYDENQDSASTAQNDTIGRALYIVDAVTGTRLWWAGPSGSGADLEVTGLNNSMPAKPAVIDLDVDGIADHVYIGDLGGKVWRFDFANGNGASSFGSATLLATLGDTDSDASNDAENNRRFYHTPSVALKDPLASQTLYVAIGSGYHAHPLNQEAHDRFYVLEDSEVLNGASMTLPLTESTLYDSTSNAIQDGATQSVIDAAIVARSAAPGWYIRLQEDASTQLGEKALSRATIFNNVLIFSTYLPEDPSSTTVAASCQAAAGFGRTYAMSLDDGSAVFNYDSSITALDKADRYVTLNHVGIPPEVQIIIPEGSLTHGRKPVLLVGTEIVDSDFDSPQPKMIYWSDQ